MIRDLTNMDNQSPSFFWTPVNDPEIQPEISGRDPLGLQPVWSGVGRLIVPHIANSIWHYEGLLAVMLGYEIARKLELNLSNKEGRRFFMAWEAVVETHWSIPNSGRHVIYGKRFFAKGLDTEPLFPVKNTNSTMREGLWKFYRGTLRRLDYLTKDLEMASNKRFSWPSSSLVTIENSFRKFLPYQKENNPQLKTFVEPIAEALESCWSNPDVIGELRYALFETPETILCKDWVKGRDKIENWKGDIEAFIKAGKNVGSESPEFALHRRLQLILRADPWFAVMSAIADWLDSNDQIAISDLVKRLSNLAKQDDFLIKSASHFPDFYDIQKEGALSPSVKPGGVMQQRWESLSNLAKFFYQDKFKIFLNEMVSYHQRTVSSKNIRWRWDNERLLCLKPSGGSGRLVLMATTGDYTFANYYLYSLVNLNKELGAKI